MKRIILFVKDQKHEVICYFNELTTIFKVLNSKFENYKILNIEDIPHKIITLEIDKNK